MCVRRACKPVTFRNVLQHMKIWLESIYGIHKKYSKSIDIQCLHFSIPGQDGSDIHFLGGCYLEGRKDREALAQG